MNDPHELLDTLRRDLAEEADGLPGQSRSYGRPHEHPRARFYPRYSPTGERLAGSVVVRPDCPRPTHGRCECPPDGSWRPSPGVPRADARAVHGVRVPAARLLPALTGQVWVDTVYEQAPDGLWHCRWPVRRALERLRGENPGRWQTAIRLLKGEPLAAVWGPHGAPPNPQAEAQRLLTQLTRWAQEERDTAWERRPRQWWDAPKRKRLSESQSIAQHGLDRTITVSGTGGPTALPRSPAADAALLGQPSGPSGAPAPWATATASNTRVAA